MAIEINEKVLGELQEEFKKRIGIYDIKDKGNEWVQISTPFPGIKRAHYEVCNEGGIITIELHFEAKDWKKDRDLVNLVEYLGPKTKNVGKYTWENWRCNKWYRCKCKIEEKIIEESREFITLFDRLIGEWKNKDEPKQLTEKDDKEFEEQTGDVELYTRDLDSVIRLRNLSIPSYQRTYCWDEYNVMCLLNDVYDHVNLSKSDKYRLGTIILHSNNGRYDIIDGQQRLVTLALLLYRLGHLSALLNQTFNSTESKSYVAYNRYLIENFCDKRIGFDNKKREEFCKGLLSKIEFSVLVLKTKSPDLAYTFFSNQNDRGVDLTDYDLLKAHHLRYVLKNSEIYAKYAAKAWDKMVEEERGKKEEAEKNGLYKFTKVTYYERVLDICIYRLRRLMGNKPIEDKNRYIKREYEAAPTIDGIPAFGEKFYFNEPIQGGSHFFTFVEYHLGKYKRFSNTDEYMCLHDHFAWGSYLWYRDVIEALLFEYYLKFGEQHLANALAVIMRCILQHRYLAYRVGLNSILAFVWEKNIAQMIERATSPTFFLAEVRNTIKEMPSPNLDTNTKKIANEAANEVSNKLKEKLIDSFKELNS